MHALLVGIGAVKGEVDLVALLTGQGFTVSCSQSAQAALDVFASAIPNIVIVDWEPVTSQDAHFCEKLRKLPRGAEAALLAVVRDDADTIDAALEAGVNDYITRPLTPAGVAARVAIVARWLHTRDYREPSAGKPLVAASYADFLALLDTSPDPAGIHRNRVFLYANPALTRALDYDTLTGVPVPAILHPDEHEQVEKRLRFVERTGQPVPTRRERFLRRDGTIEVGEAHSFLVQLPDGPAVVTAGKDVTQKEIQEAHDRHSQRLATIGKLAASVAHEINNPLTLVQFNLWDLSQLTPTLASQLRAAASEQLELRMKAIEAAVHQMQALTRDLATYARAEERKPSPVRVDELLERAVRMIAAYAKTIAGTTVAIETEPSGTVLASETRVTQVLLNLLLNAVDAVAKTAPDAIRQITARVSADKDEIVVRVCDTGPGIPPELRERVFEPFFSTKPAGQGTGLGLAVARNVVQEMGGSLRIVDGEPPFTTMFELRLPREPSAA